MTEQFDELHTQAEAQWESLQQSARPRILVGTATCGRAAGALEVLAAFEQQLDRRGLDCLLMEVGCIGMCYAEPVVSITKPGRPTVFYGSVTPAKMEQLVERYLVGDDPMPDDALGTVGEGSVDGIPPLFETPFFAPQVRRTLASCGFIDPGQIDQSLANRGYCGLARALDMAPAEVLDLLKRSGLRGKGGAGFPTWRKWEFARGAQNRPKYVICNASEGDPGVYGNKLLLESDPHCVLEGMLIAAHAVGAEHGYVYCPAAYGLALDRLRTALAQMHERGLLGEKILGRPFRFDIKIKEGAGAYVCGEETALIECIEGKRGIPRLRPPFPPIAGLWARSTVVNNVETLAGAALVLRNGPKWFTQYGTERNRGTKVLCLSGNVERAGVVEVPLGTTLREIVHGIGGGPGDGRRIKAVHCGGPGGGCLPPASLDTPVDHDSLLALGSSLGSGGLVAIDDGACMVDVAHNTLEFACRESCGQCVPCRLGTRQMLDISRDIIEGRGRPGDVDLLVELGRALRLGSLCGHGQAAANPLLSIIRYFRDEYQAHIEQKRCPAGICTLQSSPPEKSGAACDLLGAEA